MPEWEHTNGSNSAGPTAQSTRPSLKEKFDTAMPPHKKYLGMKRNIFLLALLAAFLALLALIIGLAVGLTQKSKWVMTWPFQKHSNLLRIFLGRQTSRYPRILRPLTANSPTSKQGLVPVAKPAKIPTISSLSLISSSMRPAARARKEATRIPIPCVGLRYAQSAMTRTVAR